MSRIAACFDALRKSGRRALIPYFTAGDPSPEVTVPAMHAMVEAGADIIELGVPFSDPMADGPVIQAACERALKHNVSLRDVLGMVKSFRQRNTTTPVVLMGYLNPIEVMGYETFAKAASEAGVDGVLTVDLPPEEASSLVDALGKAQIDPIFLLAPTTTDARVKRVCEFARGFIYYVSLKGVTGASTLDVGAVTKRLEQLRGLISLPIGVGFGIRDAESAAAIGRGADAVVVGSAVVRLFADNAQSPQKIVPAVTVLLKDIRGALDAR